MMEILCAEIVFVFKSANDILDKTLIMEMWPLQSEYVLNSLLIENKYYEKVIQTTSYTQYTISHKLLLAFQTHNKPETIIMITCNKDKQFKGKYLSRTALSRPDPLVTCSFIQLLGSARDLHWSE